MKRLLLRSAAALSRLFGIEIIVPPLPADAPSVSDIVCPKCAGVGSFVDYLTKRTRRCDRCGGGGLR